MENKRTESVRSELERSRTNHVIRNLIMSVLNIIVGTIMPFMVRTLTIKYLGSEYMGLNNVCSSILYAINATDLGVSGAFAYKLYKPVAEKNTDEICRLLNYYKKVYFAIGIIFAFAGLCFMPFFEYFINSDIPQGINVQVVFFIYLLNTVLGYITFAYKNILLAADQRKDCTLALATFSFVLIYGSQILLIVNKQYYLSVCALPIFTFVENILVDIVTKRMYPNYIPKGVISQKTKDEIKKDVFAVLVYRIRDISRNSFDSIVISSFAGLIVLSNYQNYYTIFNVPFLLLGICYTAFAPSIGNYALTHNKEQVFEIYRKSAFVQSVMAGWFAICYGVLIEDFIVDIWLSEQNKLPLNIALLFSVYIYLVGENYTLKTIRESVGLLNYGKQWALLEMIVNLTLNIVLMAYMGVTGVLCGTIFSMLFISIPAENYIVYRYYFKGMFIERLKMILCNLTWVAITVVISLFFCKMAPEQFLIKFIYKVFICILIPGLTLIILFFKNTDFLYIVNIIKNIVEKYIGKLGMNKDV